MDKIAVAKELVLIARELTAWGDRPSPGDIHNEVREPLSHALDFALKWRSHRDSDMRREWSEVANMLGKVIGTVNRLRTEELRQVVSAVKPAKGDIIQLLSHRENFDYVSRVMKRDGNKWLVETRSGEETWVTGPVDETMEKKYWDEVLNPKR